jgi:hypothetical protein
MEGYDLVINEAKDVTEGKAQPGPVGRSFDGIVPAHCRVTGEIDKRIGKNGKPYSIGFTIALPQKWNGRFMYQGGGGLNGILHEPIGIQPGGKPALVRGFAVASTDSGHRSDKGFDFGFTEDQEAYLNFLYKANAKVTEVAKSIIKTYYEKPIDYSYWVGCSTGGREGMIMSQRFPDYFDGIVAGAPAIRTNFSNLGIRYLQISLNQAAPLEDDGLPEVGGGLPPDDQMLVVDGFLKACDGRDGVVDEMVFDVEGCGFDPATLVCEREKTRQCLTRKQVDALEKGMAGPVDSRGHRVYSPFPYDTGINDTGNPIPGLLAIQPGPAVFPPARETRMDVDGESLAADNAAGEVGNTFKWTNLSTFAGHGGKLIFYHGVSDPWFSALDTVSYYNNLVKDNGGAETVSTWSRLFLAPGVGHCAGGEKGLDQFDMLGAIVDWVEKNKAPKKIVATGSAFSGRSRPLCPYPGYARYQGKGNSEDAKNFECRE